VGIAQRAGGKLNARFHARQIALGECEAGVCVMKSAEQAVAGRDGIVRNQALELELIYRRVPVGLAVYDRNLRFLPVNDAISRFKDL